MGEVIVRSVASRLGMEIEVTSAGTSASDGRPATEAAQRAVQRLGLDLSHHVSSAVRHESVRGADLILAMEARHVIDLVNEHGADLARTFTLPELASFADPANDHGTAWLPSVAAARSAASALRAPEISDPTGRSARQHRLVAQRITDDVEAVLRRLAPSAPADPAEGTTG